MALVPIVIDILSALTLLADISIVVLAALLLKKTKLNRVAKKAVLVAFIVALVATLGSLFFSEIALYEPCKLCWFQRIFMYPQVVILGLALLQKKKIPQSILPLSVIGAGISAYHYATILAHYSAVCLPGQTSCLTNFFVRFGYINIPMMALSAFLLIILVSCVRKGEK